MKRSLLTAAAASLMATSAQAERSFYDGAKMHELCSNDRGRAICLGYAAGLSDALKKSE
jgi:hypothetical protein